MTDREETRCACGQPLHYRHPETREMVERLITGAGGDPDATITVTDGDRQRSFRVPRHYIALHGIAAQDLLTGRVVFPEVEG